MMPGNGDANKHPILPQLKDTHQIANFNSAGVWEHRSAEEAKKVYEGLKVEQVEFQVNSIPDIWARPVLFEMALYESPALGEDGLAHPLHKRVRGEWRGLLALLGLREWRGITELAVVPVFKRPQGEWAEFLKVAATLKPGKTLAADTAWLDISIILFGGAAIAMTSPTTLVCTATEYVGRIPKDRVPWFNGAVLEDPTPHLSLEERQALALWIDRLRSNVSAHPGLDQNSREANGLLAELRQFAAALLSGQQSAAGDLYRNGTSGLELQGGLFRHLRCALEEKAANPLFSHVRLIPSLGADGVERRQNRPHLLLLDERIASEWGESSQNIAAWGSLPLAAACADIASNSNRSQIAGRTLDNAEWVRPGEIFLDQLFVLATAHALPGSYRDATGKDPTCAGELQNRGGDNVTALVPLKENLLGYLSPDELARRITFSVENDGSSDGIRVTVRLPLAGPSLGGKDFVVTRHYGFKRNEVVTLQEVPVVEVWPYLKAKHWKTYYSYCSTGDHAGPLSVRPYALDAVATTRDLKSFTVTQLDRFPEAMVCSMVDGNRTFPAGLILLSVPRLVPTIDHVSCSVGVDFGTTGTRVYFRGRNTKPKALTFSDRSHPVTKNSSLRPYMYFQFFPPDPVPTESLLSLFRDFRTGEKASLPVLDGHICIVKDYSQFDAGKSEISKNMKWGHERERILAELFLLQLCCEAAAEAAADGISAIDWRFSYPSSFSQSDRRAFAQIWRSIVSKNSAATGVQHKAVTSCDESSAAARFFADRMGAPLDRGTVCIDIGGGTSDIAIWQKENQLRCQASVRFAGRDILLYPVFTWPDFLDVYFKQNVRALTDAKENRDTDAFFAQADALLKECGDSLLGELSKKHANSKVQEFVGLLEAGMCGLFYYVGLLLRALNKEGRYDPQMPNVYLGGNAAKLLHWCALGEFLPGCDIDKRLKQVLLAATGFPRGHFAIEISVEPKAEVAYGLLIDEQFVGAKPVSEEEDVDDQGQIPVIAGESFTQNGTVCDRFSWVTAAGVHAGLRVDPELSTFREFLKCLHLELDEVTRQRLVERTNNELINDSKRPKEQIRLQPPFVTVLKHYLAWRSESWAAGKAAATGGKES